MNAEPRNIDTSLLHVAVFRDAKGYELAAHKMTLPGLRNLVLNTTASKKDSLPLLKLASFGNTRSQGKSLRNNANVLSINGVELDYDGENMPFDGAVAKTEKAHLRALIYTSPSHSERKPRWRILLPTSRPLAPGERANLVARVNGLFEGIFANESFTLSQGYYYGSVANNPAHRAVIVDGDSIDLRDDLDAGAMHKSADTFEGHGRGGARGFEAHLARLGDGPGLQGFNGPLCAASAAYVAANSADLDRDTLKAKLREAINAAPKKQGREADIARYCSDRYLDALIESANKKFGDASASSGMSLSDFVAYLPGHNYIFLPTREPWPASSVDASLPPVANPDKSAKQGWIPAHTWLDKYAAVQQMTWCPGLPLLITDKLVDEGGWIERPGVTTLNLYRPPTIKLGNAVEAERWVDLVERIYPDCHKEIIQFFAQRVQQPHVKINYSLLLGGAPGIGKDTILEPVKQAAGPWNWAEVTPAVLMGRFNGYLKSVVLRISEARDLGDMNRYAFYEHTKTLMAAPPDVLRCDEKNLREHAVFNVTGVVITTNHLTDGIYLPPDDRRHLAAWSEATKDAFVHDFWREHWR